MKKPKKSWVSRNFLPFSLSLFLAVTVTGGLFQFVHADDDDDESVTELSKEQKELEKQKEEQLDDLNAKIKAYKKIIEMKSEQGNTLADQIESYEAQAAALQLEIDQSRNKINELEGDISTLESRISEKSQLIDQQKKLLAEFMRTYYSQYSSDIAPLLLTADESSVYFKESSWNSDVSSKISDMLSSIKSLRESMVAEQSALEDKKKQAAEVHENLEDRSDSLESAKAGKEDLLERTQADEAKYKDLLQNVEEQKRELLDFGAASNIGELSDSVKDYPRPDEDEWASTSWYFSQKDSRWGGKRIGNSNSLMRDYGCAVAALSMVFRSHGASIDPGKMLRQKIFSYDLIRWPGSWSPSISLGSSISHGNVSWSKIDDAIDDDNPVIVYIKKTNGQGGHYVVITGKDKKDYIVHDPYFGPNLYLGTSRALVGKIGNDSGTRIDQMIIYKK
jgi:peptidoglycan hydrolase CwlO-like protein